MFKYSKYICILLKPANQFQSYHSFPEINIFRHYNIWSLCMTAKYCLIQFLCRDVGALGAQDKNIDYDYFKEIWHFLNTWYLKYHTLFDKSYIRLRSTRYSTDKRCMTFWIIAAIYTKDCWRQKMEWDLRHFPYLSNYCHYELKNGINKIPESHRGNTSQHKTCTHCPLFKQFNVGSKLDWTQEV